MRTIRARETGDSALHIGLSPASRARVIYLRDPGACAPGFMLSPAIAGSQTDRAIAGSQTERTIARSLSPMHIIAGY
jgi:hypothetical protein